MLDQANSLPAKSRLFSRPRLPAHFVAGLAFIIFADLVITLVAQPVEYWLASGRSSFSSESLQGMMRLNPIVFVSLGFVYLVLLGLLVWRLNRIIALVLWMVAAYVHLYDIVNWLECRLNILLPLSPGYACRADYFLLWLMASLVVGGLILTILPRSSPPGARPRLWRASGKIAVAVLGAIGALLLAAGLVRAITVSKVGWRPVVPAHRPEGRTGASIAYDTRRGRAVLFGGTGPSGYPDTTWEWDGVDWQQLFPETSPPGRHSQAMAYDEARGVVVLFGGEDAGGLLEGVWEWDGTNWRVVYPNAGPTHRCCHKLLYDPLRGRVVLYGGIDADGVFHDSAWEWDGAGWSEIFQESRSPLSSGSGLAYDNARRQFVGFTGVTAFGTWLWQGGQWLNPSLAAQPPARNNAKMIYDFHHQQVVLYGGEKDDEEFDDTWLFDGQKWQRLELPRSPGPRLSPTIFYDYQRQRVMLFGGQANGASANDLWALELPEGP
ncbi:MAG: kelch repeat-containing protein [Chloroflexi bacterium]|nr:kelch repeat-containing protein [Chloroflexota bacterium]MCI0649925.1 kelch repeat-containing protein [Chloroflexota bacterium]MCI0729838.1 kelch repeat-containing protein [Chloroflexota bacterium]